MILIVIYTRLDFYSNELVFFVEHVTLMLISREYNMCQRNVMFLCGDECVKLSSDFLEFLVRI